MELREWNNYMKQLKSIILKEDRMEESKEIIFKIHSMVHASSMSGINEITFEDKVWDGLDEYTFRSSVNEKGRTVAYGIWHSSRIEDITMNILVADTNQVFNEGDWKKRIGSKISDTGNALDRDGILRFSESINMEELKNYRIEVGRRTQEIIKNLNCSDMKRKFDNDKLQRILDEGAVLNVEASNWLIDFWGKKNISGIILMPATRHNMVHINECLKAKKSLKK